MTRQNVHELQIIWTTIQFEVADHCKFVICDRLRAIAKLIQTDNFIYRASAY